MRATGTSKNRGGIAPGKVLLTATDVAAICEIDLKTVHNWVDAGRIQHFRTPGRHLRFRREDVVAFLRSFGYPVPADLAVDPAEILIERTVTLIDEVLHDSTGQRRADLRERGLALLAEIHAFAEEFAKTHSPLDTIPATAAAYLLNIALGHATLLGPRDGAAGKVVAQ